MMLASNAQMFVLLVLWVCFVKADRLDEALARNAQICGQSPIDASQVSARIVGGSDAQQFQFPWQISLRRYAPKLKRWYHTCGGAIIDAQWILTAAHCTMPNGLATPEMFKVRVNEYDYNQTDGHELDINVSQIITHTGFTMHTIDKDINLLKLEKPIHFNQTDSKLAPICIGKVMWLDKHNQTRSPEEVKMVANETTNLNSSESHFVKGPLCVSSGWGRLSYGGSFPTILKHVKVDIVDFDYCVEAYKSFVNVTDGMLCSGREGKGTCSGDSGGPLQCFETSHDAQDKSGRWSLYGLTSWAMGCAENHYPSVAARVVKFRDWIAQQILLHQ